MSREKSGDRRPCRHDGCRSGLAALVTLAAVTAVGCSGSTTDTAAPSTTSVTSDAPQSTSTETTTETTTAVTTATTTTTQPPAPAIDLGGRGPHPVGVTTVTLDSGAPVEVWYPAVAGTTGTASYDLRDFTPDFLAPLLTTATNAVFDYEASRDAEIDAEGGPYPLVVFSHGYAGMRVQSTTLTSHLASHGMVVASTDHPSRDLRNVLGNTASGNPAEAVVDVLEVIDLMTSAADPTGESGTEPLLIPGDLGASIDPTRIALLGHSAGGGTVQGAANDERVTGFVAMAAGGPSEGFEVPAVPGFFIAGSTDGVVSPSERTRPAHLAATTPAWYLEIAQTGHNGFDDFCLIGDGTGIVGVAEQAGLGAILQAQPALRVLGEDGCIPPAAPVALAHPLINHSVTAWLQWLFSGEADPEGLGPEDLDRFALGSVLLERR